MTEQHPIIPPPELRCEWQSESRFKVISVEREDYMIDRAAQWGADTELVACLANIHTMYGKDKADWLLAMRRPNPPSLKEQALEILQRLSKDGFPCNYQEDSDWDTIRRALEQLDD
jgi:hypothetical protein